VEKTAKDLPVAGEKEYQLPPKIKPPSGGWRNRLNKWWLIGGGLGVIAVALIGWGASRGGMNQEVMPLNSGEKQVNEERVAAGMNGYRDADYDYRIEYPDYWALSEGNLHDPVLPASAITLESGNEWVVVAVVDPAEEEVGEDDFFPGGGKLIGENDFQEVKVGGLMAKRLTVVQEISGKYLKTIYTRVANGGRAFYVSTSFPVDLRTNEPVDLEGEETERVYEQVLKSFRVLSQGGS
jgi:hypothetical protein